MLEQNSPAPTRAAPWTRSSALATPGQRDAMRKLGQPIPLTLLANVLLDWALIVAAILVAQAVQAAWCSVLAIAFIATRQHALLVLMHEFTHWQFSRTRPALNDTLGDFLTALPFMVTIHGFRRDHFQHHRATATADDPNWVSCIQQARYQFPRSRKSMVGLLLLHCLGAFGLREFKTLMFDSKLSVQTPRSTQVRQGIFMLLVLAVAYAFDLWRVIGLYWFVPMLTVMMALFYLRDVAEHFALPSAGIDSTRTTLVGWLEGFLVAPHHVNFHTEHHLYPAVPFCRLHRLHQLLMQDPAYSAQAVVTKGYLCGVLQDATRHQNRPRQDGHLIGE